MIVETQSSTNTLAQRFPPRAQLRHSKFAAAVVGSTGQSLQFKPIPENRVADPEQTGDGDASGFEVVIFVVFADPSADGDVFERGVHRHTDRNPCWIL